MKIFPNTKPKPDMQASVMFIRLLSIVFLLFCSPHISILCTFLTFYAAASCRHVFLQSLSACLHNVRTNERSFACRHHSHHGYGRGYRDKVSDSMLCHATLCYAIALCCAYTWRSEESLDPTRF